MRVAFRRRSLVVAAAVVVVLAVVAITERATSGPLGNLVECAVVTGLLCVLAWAARGAARDALMVAASLLFGLTLIDGGLRLTATETRDAPVATLSDSGLDKVRPIVGWGPSRPGVFRLIKAYPDGRVVFDVNVTIDRTLNRLTLPTSDRGAIAFFGDSFIFGDGLNDDETLPQTFARLTGGKVPVWNLAFSGWSPANNLAALQSTLYRPLLAAPRHFVLFTAAFHVERTACKGAWAVGPSARYVMVGDRLENSGPCATKLQATLSRFARRFALYDRLADAVSGVTRQDVLTYLKIVETFIETARTNYDAPTTILFKTMDEDYLRGTGFTQDMLIEALRKAGADVLVEALPPIADDSLYRIKGDGHPTGLANEAVAREIETHLELVDPAALAGEARTAEP